MAWKRSGVQFPSAPQTILGSLLLTAGFSALGSVSAFTAGSLAGTAEEDLFGRRP